MRKDFRGACAARRQDKVARCTSRVRPGGTDTFCGCAPRECVFSGRGSSVKLSTRLGADEGKVVEVAEFLAARGLRVQGQAQAAARGGHVGCARASDVSALATTFAVAVAAGFRSVAVLRLRTGASEAAARTDQLIGFFAQARQCSLEFLVSTLFGENSGGDAAAEGRQKDATREAAAESELRRHCVAAGAIIRAATALQVLRAAAFWLEAVVILAEATAAEEFVFFPIGDGGSGHGRLMGWFSVMKE